MNDNSRSVLPKQLEITWGNDPIYWRVSDEQAQLRSVCWFDVAATFCDLFPGVYNVVLRGTAENNFPFQCSVTTDLDAELNESAGTEQGIDQINAEGWSCATVPISSEQGKVTVRLHNHSGRWKRGLTLGSITLEPIVQNRFQKTKRAQH